MKIEVTKEWCMNMAKLEQETNWVLVPQEATQEMCAAAVVFANGNAVYKNVAAEALRIEEAIYGEAYAAMLAAAPKRSHAPTPCECPVRATLDAMLCDAFKRRAAVEQALYDMAGGKTPMPDAARLRELAQQLGVPGGNS